MWFNFYMPMIITWGVIALAWASFLSVIYYDFVKGFF